MKLWGLLAYSLMQGVIMGRDQKTAWVMHGLAKHAVSDDAQKLYLLLKSVNNGELFQPYSGTKSVAKVLCEDTQRIVAAENELERAGLVMFEGDQTDSGQRWFTLFEVPLDARQMAFCEEVIREFIESGESRSCSPIELNKNQIKSKTKSKTKLNKTVANLPGQNKNQNNQTNGYPDPLRRQTKKTELQLQENTTKKTTLGSSKLSPDQLNLVCSDSRKLWFYLNFGAQAIVPGIVDSPLDTAEGFRNSYLEVHNRKLRRQPFCWFDGDGFDLESARSNCIRWTPSQWAGFFWYHISAIRESLGMPLYLPNWGMLLRNMKAVLGRCTAKMVFDYILCLLQEFPEIQERAGESFVIPLDETTMTNRGVVQLLEAHGRSRRAAVGTNRGMHG